MWRGLRFHRFTPDIVDRSATLANASLTSAIAAISRQHREAGFESPTQDARSLSSAHGRHKA